MRKAKETFRKYNFQLAVLVAALSFSLLSCAHAKQVFLCSPYVQLGYNYNGKSLAVLWLSEETKLAGWLFEYKDANSKTWQKVSKIDHLAVNGHPNIFLYCAEMSDLSPGNTLSYRIRQSDNVIFESTVKAAPKKGSPLDFAVTGDIGLGSKGEAEIASLWKQKQPELLLIAGDIVYPIGTINNYLRNFFPFLSAAPGAASGERVMQSTITVGVPGNHDLAEGGFEDARNLNTAPDSLSYFVLFRQPLNGPISEHGENTANLYGSQERKNDFLRAAADAYPKMANFSFDYGDCHFLVLDGNSYMDWTDEKLRNWVESDLKSTKAKWKFVSFHQPGFNSDLSHRNEQRMRLLADIFENNGVDICFSGHSHSYQRSYPIHFEVQKENGSVVHARGAIPGQFKLDRSFDGIGRCKADGVIYIISGAGGAHLTAPELETEKAYWLPFTVKFCSRKHSMTFCHVESKRLELQQIAADGSILDSFRLEK